MSEVYYEYTDDGMIGELSADPDGLIFPIVLNEYPDGTAEWLTLSEVGLYADLPNLIYDLEPLDPGLEFVELVITDYRERFCSRRIRHPPATALRALQQPSYVASSAITP